MATPSWSSTRRSKCLVMVVGGRWGEGNKQTRCGEISHMLTCRLTDLPTPPNLHPPTGTPAGRSASSCSPSCRWTPRSGPSSWCSSPSSPSSTGASPCSCSACGVRGVWCLSCVGLCYVWWVLCCDQHTWEYICILYIYIRRSVLLQCRHTHNHTYYSALHLEGDLNARRSSRQRPTGPM